VLAFRFLAIDAISAIIDCMASITIRNLPENTKRRLRIRAAYNGHSMEQEARDLIEAELARAEAVFENQQIKRGHRVTLGVSDLKSSPRRGTDRDPRSAKT
jgi:antitoxin FitA